MRRAVSSGTNRQACDTARCRAFERAAGRDRFRFFGGISAAFQRLWAQKNCPTLSVVSRPITATNRNLTEEVRGGGFREDSVLPHQHSHDRPTPTTRSCGDIRLFVDKFLGPGWEIAPDALERIVTYRWPGNIRQLINIIERAKILADDQVIVASDLPPELHAPPSGSIASADLTPVDNLQSLQKSKVVEILERVHGNKTRAARQLGITRRSLYRLLERYGPDDDATTDGTV